MGNLLTVYLSLFFLISGSALEYGLRIGFYLICSLPFLLCGFSYLGHKKLVFPRQLTLVWIGFSFFYLIATLFSPDYQISIENFLLYQSAFLTAIYFFNNKKTSQEIIERILIITSILFTLAFIFKNYLLQQVKYIDVNQIYNLFFPVTSNNNLGILLGAAILILFLRKRYTFMAFFVPFFLISYSRSAYLSLFSAFLITFFLKSKEWLNKCNKKIILMAVIIAALTFVLGVFIFVPRPDSLSHRDMYFKEAITGFLDRPFTGYGSGNFVAVSRNYAAESRGTFGSTSHNILLDILSGGGVFSFILFSLFVFLILKKGRHDLSYIIYTYLLVCFMFSYIFMLPSVLLLFFIIAGLTYEEKESIQMERVAPAFAVIIMLASLYLGYSEALYIKGNYKESLQIYPFRKEAYEEYISQMGLNQKAEIYTHINRYKKYFPDVFEQLNYSANTYKRIGDYKNSLKDFMTTYENGTGFNPAVAREIHQLHLLLGDREAAYGFGIGFINRILSNQNKYPHMVYDTKIFCIYLNKFFLDKDYCF